MTEELKASRMTMGIHAVVAIIVGYLSPMLGSMYGTNWVAGAAGVVILVAVGFLSEKIVKQKGMKFWAANGIFIYLLIWLVSWTYFFNLL